MTDIITRLRADEVFIFGSNKAGRHGKGAALQALKFGALRGIGEGMQGQSYAFPTLSSKFRRLSDDELERSRDNLYATCRSHRCKRFLLTKVGCGLAGFPEGKMRALFADHPVNLVLPGDWVTP